MAWAGFDDFLSRAAERLDPVSGPARLPEGGDLDLVPAEKTRAIRPAAVLIGVVPKGDDPVVVLTQRPETMSTHAGQVAFPGGKVDPTDADAVAAALREADEEVGAAPDQVQLIGRSGPYITGSAFRITPVVGLLPEGFDPTPDPIEVAAVFETPLAFLMNPVNHEQRQTDWNGAKRHYYAMPHNGRMIWGVTAGIIRALYLRLYGEGED